MRSQTLQCQSRPLQPRRDLKTPPTPAIRFAIRVSQGRNAKRTTKSRSMYRGYSDAIAKYQLAISKKADKAIFWWNLALAQMKSNQVAPALEPLRRSCELNEKYREDALHETLFESLKDNATFQSIVQAPKRAQGKE